MNACERVVRDQSAAWADGLGMEESASRHVTPPDGLRRRREADLVGSSFLLLDALLVGCHWSIVRRGGGIAVSFDSVVVSVFVGLVLCWGVVGDGSED